MPIGGCLFMVLVSICEFVLVIKWKLSEVTTACCSAADAKVGLLHRFIVNSMFGIKA